MKRCGYRPGLCSNPGPCNIHLVSFGLGKEWRESTNAAVSCPYYVMVAGSRQMAFNLPRRLHHWDADNPYEKE